MRSAWNDFSDRLSGICMIYILIYPLQKQPPEVFCLRSATLLKKRLWHRCFSVDFVKFLRAPFLLLLPLGIYPRCVRQYAKLFRYSCRYSSQMNKFDSEYKLTLFRSSHWRCSVKKLFLKFRKSHRKTPVPESLTL